MTAAYKISMKTDALQRGWSFRWFSDIDHDVRGHIRSLIG